MNYESPIAVNYTDDFISSVVDRVMARMEDEVVYRVGVTAGVEVDKAELLKALEYDRGQYEKGYTDGFCDAVKRQWTPAKERLPKPGEYILLSWVEDDGKGRVEQGQYFTEPGFLTTEYMRVEAVAWMPLPEPYREDKHAGRDN